MEKTSPGGEEYGFLIIGNYDSWYTDFAERTEFFPSFYGGNRAVRMFRVQKADFVKR